MRRPKLSWDGGVQGERGLTRRNAFHTIGGNFRYQPLRT
ncbi:hypothetical protein RSPO_c01564 [Ralstonia solanacearum Po82]|uniref:Uncharacterized protein n=1 Tax=Ralstonia solanacearum (strain Po82) TaxID=1031711 RepID=F6G0L9_RALS8|nr:hypothetical protein RSPO_c01564 [Ralstonia solanacearum Po82]